MRVRIRLDRGKLNKVPISSREIAFATRTRERINSSTICQRSCRSFSARVTCCVRCAYILITSLSRRRSRSRWREDVWRLPERNDNRNIKSVLYTTRDYATTRVALCARDWRLMVTARVRLSRRCKSVTRALDIPRLLYRVSCVTLVLSVYF